MLAPSNIWLIGWDRMLWRGESGGVKIRKHPLPVASCTTLETDYFLAGLDCNQSFYKQEVLIIKNFVPLRRYGT
jgi:hypothetical protein